MEVKMHIRINPPPADERCAGCNKHIDELLECVDEDEFDFLGPDTHKKKLMKTFREFCGQIEASWECSDCLGLSNEENWGKRMEWENALKRP
jgi:hypothetical protein